MIVGSGQSSMLYSPKGDYKNFRFKAEVQINDHGNSGMYFRSPTAEGDFSKGYEAQIDSTHGDPIRDGLDLRLPAHLQEESFPRTRGSHTKSSVWTRLARDRLPTHHSLDRRRAALRAAREDESLGQGVFRIPAARSGQQGSDPQDRGERGQGEIAIGDQRD